MIIKTTLENKWKPNSKEKNVQKKDMLVNFYL